MGRSGGGGGFSGGGHHSSSGHHSSGHIGSSRSSFSSSSHSGSRTSFSGPSHSGPRPSYGGPRPSYGGPRPGYGAPRPVFRGPRRYSPSRTTVYVNNGGANGNPNYDPNQNVNQTSAGTGGCGTWLLIAFVVIFIAIVIGNVMSSKAGSKNYSTDMERIYDYAEEQYTEQFGNRQDGLIFVIDDNDNGQAVWGLEAAKIVDRYDDTLWDAYDRAYNDDLGFQWKSALTSAAQVIASNGETPIKSSAKFDDRCYRDDLGWVDTPKNLIQGVEAFYDATGVQIFIVHTYYSTIERATSGPNYTGPAFFIGLAIVLIAYFIFRFVTKRKEQKIKELEETNKILNTPLEKFSDSAADDLAAKYEDK